MTATTQGRSGGFTLIELMIVIAVIGLLAAVLLPNIFGAGKQAGITATEATFLRLQEACNAFQRQNGYYPPADLRCPEKEGDLATACAKWKSDNGQNTCIESLLAFCSVKSLAGGSLADLGPKLTNWDKDENGAELPQLHSKDRKEVADYWNTPIAYFTKFTMEKSATIVGEDGEVQSCSALRKDDGSFHGAGKFQFVSAGFDKTFGTADDLHWPKD